MLKVQDSAYIFILAALFFLRKPSVFLYSGYACILLAIPLFAGWKFFTAERLTWYAASFFLMYLLLPWNKEKISH